MNAYVYARTPVSSVASEPRPLGAYVRPLERDCRHTAALIAQGFPVGTGIVVDACSPGRGRDLRSCARDTRQEVVLDPRPVELSTVGDTAVRRAGLAMVIAWTGGVLISPRWQRKTSRVLQPPIRLLIVDCIEEAAPWKEVDARRREVQGRRHTCEQESDRSAGTLRTHRMRRVIGCQPWPNDWNAFGRT